MPRRTAAWLKVTGLLAAAALLGACGQPAKPTTSGVGDKNVAAGGRLFATADAETAKLGADVGPGVFPRTVTHALGKTKIEKAPTRVVVLDSGELDDVLALGITPVGMATTAGQTGVPSYLSDRVKGIPTIGDINNLNLEKIAALRPDLILGSKLRANDLYPQLSKSGRRCSASAPDSRGRRTSCSSVPHWARKPRPSRRSTPTRRRPMK
ncbi:MAG TPA: ABC transporter substrate-binding protein [Amycolatopsis sp.]|jgi:iron complex transport system substrate-binding protein|nr:ABC transporter substrate-binding protein [Amycolatopsis sp.]